MKKILLALVVVSTMTSFALANDDAKPAADAAAPAADHGHATTAKAKKKKKMAKEEHAAPAAEAPKAE